MGTKVDLNCDLGESFGAYAIPVSSGVLERISSANVACGFHAGDPVVMADSVARCKRRGVQVGAHPGLPDLMGFGRREMHVSGREAADYVLYQVGALQAFCRAEGVDLQHVKLHGALYNMTARDEELARAIAGGLLRLPEPRPILLAPARSVFSEVARSFGLTVCDEGFADRAYDRDGGLVSRRRADAVIGDPDAIADRAVRMVKEGKVETVDGADIDIQVDSLCVHGDNPRASAIVERIADAFDREGVSVVPLRALAGPTG